MGRDDYFILTGIYDKLGDSTSALFQQLQSVQAELDYKGLPPCHLKALQLKMAKSQMMQDLICISLNYILRETIRV